MKFKIDSYPAVFMRNFSMTYKEKLAKDSIIRKDYESLKYILKYMVSEVKEIEDDDASTLLLMNPTCEIEENYFEALKKLHL
jgi:hypothetical protein